MSRSNAQSMAGTRTSLDANTKRSNVLIDSNAREPRLGRHKVLSLTPPSKLKGLIFP